MPSFHRPSVLACCVVGATLLILGSASAAAQASTLQLTVGSEPVESITTQLGGMGTVTESEDRLYVKVQPAGGEVCAANPSADQGEEVISQYLENAGSYSQSVNWTPRIAGSYVVCGWLVHAPEGSATIAAKESIPVTVRIPHLSLSIGIPATVQSGQTFQIVTIAQAETGREAWEYILPSTGGGCPANAAAASMASGSSESLYEWNIVGGPLTQTTNESLSNPGVYLVCAYFEYPNSESAPEATAIARTTVVSPPPPCVVPQLVSGASLASVEQEIHAADCTVGSVSSLASTKVARGVVLGLNPESGTKLSAGAAVNIMESAGRPCVVPVVKGGSTLAHVEHQLAAADCAVSISYLHSRHVRRGRAIGLASRPHTQLSPLARVLVLVSAGRGHGR